MVFEYLKTVSVGNVDRFLVGFRSDPSAHYLLPERESSSLQGASHGRDLLFSLSACPLLSAALVSGASCQSPEMGVGGGEEVGSDELCGGLRWRPG